MLPPPQARNQKMASRDPEGDKGRNSEPTMVGEEEHCWAPSMY